jgi:hypothetical protein
VRYEASGACSNSMVCHCRSCRRAAGAPVVRTICGACGTPLTYRHESYGDAIDITTCSLDEPERFPPTHHSWLSHDVSWVKFGDGLPAFAEFRPSSSDR